MNLIAGLLPSLYKKPNGDPISLTDIDSIPILIANVIQLALTLSSVLAIIFIIYGGIQYIVSQGDPGRVGEAKSTIRNAVIGLILSAGAFLLVKFFAGRFS